jgi:hypothetical protein
VAVWNVVHNLPDRPATRPIGRVKLLPGTAGDGIAQALWRSCDLRDRVGALSGRKRRLWLVLPDWVTQIHYGPPQVEWMKKTKLKSRMTGR